MDCKFFNHCEDFASYSCSSFQRRLEELLNSRMAGHPVLPLIYIAEFKNWIPAFAGMTAYSDVP
jgi:hypothetical protein